MWLVLFRGVAHTCMLRSCYIRNILWITWLCLFWKTHALSVFRRGHQPRLRWACFFATKKKQRQVLIYIKVVWHFVKNLKKTKLLYFCSYHIDEHQRLWRDAHMPSLSRSLRKYLYDRIKTASAAPLLLVAHLEHVGFRGMVHICTIFSTRTHARRQLSRLLLQRKSVNT